MLRPVPGLVLTAFLALAGTVQVASAQVAPGSAPSAAAEAAVARLSATMKIAETIAVLRDEGIAYGASLEAELFPGRGGDDWALTVDRIYDTPTMVQRFDAALAREIGDDAATLAAAEAFFGDARGQRILTLEIEGRRALLDQAVEDAARARAEEMAASDAPRLATLRRFAEANDLIEANVQGALNANLAFYQGMAEAGAFGDEMTEAQILADVWGQEDAVRAETEDWLYPYLALAYGPLDDAEVEAYIDFSLTASGQRLNAALFAAFDAIFRPISRDLGRAAARQLLGQDI